ncbi:hypothetical protein GGR28_003268 [Lewinella aquimaris]|uniref:Uncharacterized protein n=1 Tax=Neolewinella aquimaris TaxID=1835722 RepID=A0A840E9L4_9BACT|nr:hypothetical protein [Neolewinella aquimaris]MBB4080633.1 hypothetical protein [Neolewinella aquimaris]
MDYRQKSLRNLAARNGYQFLPDDDHGLHRQLEGFRLADRGRNNTISNILRIQQGLLDHDVHIFDYHYTEYASKHPVYQTVLFLQSQRLVLPELCLQPETLVHKLGELFGIHDIDFVRYPKFSKQYRLTGDDEHFIRHHFNDQVLNYFTLNKGWSLEGVGYYLLLYKRGLLLPPEEIEPLYRKALEVSTLFSTVG